MWNNTDAVNAVYSAKTKQETHENRRKSAAKWAKKATEKVWNWLCGRTWKVDKFNKVSNLKYFLKNKLWVCYDENENWQLKCWFSCPSVSEREPSVYCRFCCVSVLISAKTWPESNMISFEAVKQVLQVRNWVKTFENRRKFAEKWRQWRWKMMCIGAKKRSWKEDKFYNLDTSKIVQKELQMVSGTFTNIHTKIQQ